MLERVINKDLDYIGDIMSNFDHEIDKQLESKLKEEECWAGYPAWEFHANVWYKNGKFQCEVWRYHSLVDIIESETLEEIMEEASYKWGWQ